MITGQKKVFLIVYCILFLFASANAQKEQVSLRPTQERITLSSPDGKNIFYLELTDKGELLYEVFYTGKPVILHSGLGVNGWLNGFTLKTIERKQQDTSWKPVYGERALVRDKYNEATYVLWRDNKERNQMNLQVRAYNEGIAFRYFFEEYKEGGADIDISREFTEFSMPAETRAWYVDMSQGSYSLLPLADWKTPADRPLTLELKNGLFVSLAEAQMVDYSRIKFGLHPQKPNTITIVMHDRVELTTGFATPWRVIMVAQKATDLLQNNDIILNLNPPCAIDNISWIKPGKAVREMTLTTDGAIKLIDFAVKRHLQYIEFDAGWYGFEYSKSADASVVNVDPRRNKKSDLDLQKVIQYGKEKGIGVWLYVNQRALESNLDQLLPLYKKWGIAGLKFGFVHVGSHRWTTWMHDAIKKCAQYNLMVDVHDDYRPTGFSRSYPNLLTQEGVKGDEAMPDGNSNTVLPFTRYIAGAADHTICYYHRPELKKSLTTNSNSLKTTSGHQLALAVVCYSPLQFMYWYDRPEDSQGEPELEFFDHVPTIWDDTKVMDGEIGKYITIARRSGEEWFVGSINNNTPRDLKVEFSFLPKGKKYTATVYYDDVASTARTHVSMKQIRVTNSSFLNMHLNSSGGQSVWIRPVN